MPIKENVLSSRAAPRPRGVFVISLDFELYWGVRHAPSVAKYFGNLRGARAAVVALLKLFAEYEIHATWATVGFLFFESTDALLRFAPTLRPLYQNPKLSPYDDLPPREAMETPESIFFAPSLIRLIAKSAHQEIGTHSFSHYYALEPGQNVETFRQDMQSAYAVAEAFGLQLRSMVFAKNQCNKEYLGACSDWGITSYRGTPPSWPYRAADDKTYRAYHRRLIRLLDTYLPISPACYQMPMPSSELPLNLPASHFLRPYSRLLAPLETMRLQRIKHEMTAAASSGKVYHLWWHPHNFGANLELNLAFLRKILEHYRQQRDRYGLESLNMSELTDRCFMSSPTYQTTEKTGNFETPSA
ncbi:MAG: polysaccharide deacetylase family protein [Deltaproteobacteria bacterium]|nr:polysaccharide deacetylase family protein [Deltaproteobacteria bacterium]